MWVLLDNYDSFTHILHHYLLQTGHECQVIRNDTINLRTLIALNPERLILSPGPGRPELAGITMEAIAHFHDRIPILGICLGHQALGIFYGAKLIHAPEPVHGIQSPINHMATGIFKGLPNPFLAMRYHSLSLDALEKTALQSTASTEDGINMAIQHPHFPSSGFQAHPESIGTPDGQQLLRNWAEMFTS